MSKSWMQWVVPAIVLGVAWLLWQQQQPMACALWLVAWLGLGHLHQRWMLANLREWAALPLHRSLRMSPFPGSPWTRAFSRLSEGIETRNAAHLQLTGELENMHAAVDKMNDALLLLDRFHHIEWSNVSARNLFGLTNSSGLRRPIHHYIRDAKFGALLDQSLREIGDYPDTQRLTLPHRPGSVFFLELLRIEANRRVLIVRDVTEQARLDTMRSDFLANVSHELRTPLTVVAGYAETLLDIELPAEQQRKHLETIARQSGTMRNLVADLLALSGLEQDIALSSEQEVDIAALFTDIEPEARALSNGRHAIHFEINQTARVLGVPDELASALRNLVSNAVRYTPDGGRIEVRFVLDSGSAILSVKDSGLGIEAHHLPRLTERFYRVDSGRSRDAGGTGLGLAIVKRIASRHEMELSIDSTLGVGSQFTLTIPARRLRVAAPAAQSQVGEPKA
jgi:two-component system, OmpR family, phosphate regulon sensor histidine kinase PhoR